MAKTADDKKWEIQSAADTLIKAEEIKKDKALFKDVMAELRKRRDAVTKIVS